MPTPLDTFDKRFFGFNPPFFGGKENILTRQTGLRLIKNDIIQLLMTVPGERVHRPTFGSPLRSYLFELNTSSDVELLKQDIRETIRLNEDRVIVQDIESERDNRNLFLKIIMTLTDSPLTSFFIELNLPFTQEENPNARDPVNPIRPTQLAR